MTSYLKKSKKFVSAQLCGYLQTQHTHHMQADQETECDQYLGSSDQAPLQALPYNDL